MNHLTMIQTSNSEIEILLRKVLKSSAFKGGAGDADVNSKRSSRDFDAPGSKGQGDGTRAKENRYESHFGTVVVVVVVVVTGELCRVYIELHFAFL